MRPPTTSLPFLRAVIRVPVLTKQPYSTTRDRGRYRVLELYEAEPQRVVLLPWPSHVQVNVVESVDGANRLARGEPGAALHPDAHHVSHVIVRGHEARGIEDLVAALAADSQVHVRDRADADRFVQSAELTGRNRVGHDAAANGAHRCTFLAMYIHAGVKPFGAVAATSFAERSRELEWSLDRIDRPQQRLPRERLGVEPGLESR